MPALLRRLLLWRLQRRLGRERYEAASERLASPGELRFPVIGTRREGGSGKLSASTGTKEHGTRTPETGTTADSNSVSARGKVYTVADYLRMPSQGSSFTARGFSGKGTGGVTTGPTPLGSAD